MSDSSLNDIAKEHKLGQDHKRQVDNKKKWAFGERAPDAGEHPTRRPMKPSPPAASKHLKREIEYQQNKAAQIAKISRKHDTRFETDTSMSDSSAEEDIRETSAAPEPDAGLTYSFDAPRGPGKGSQILGMALAKAVEKYEFKATEKLVKDEYEVVGKEKPMNVRCVIDEDDFELV